MQDCIQIHLGMRLALGDSLANWRDQPSTRIYAIGPRMAQNQSAGQVVGQTSLQAELTRCEDLNSWNRRVFRPYVLPSNPSIPFEIKNIQPNKADLGLHLKGVLWSERKRAPRYGHQKIRELSL